jgi:hypothetical protein
MLLLLTPTNLSLASPVNTAKENQTVDCRFAISATDALVNSHEALIHREWEKYSQFVKIEDLERFKQTFLDLLNAISPDYDAMVIFEEIVSKSNLAKTTPEDAFAITVEKFLLNGPPINSLLLLDSFTVMDTLQLTDHSAQFVIREFYSASEQLATSDAEIDLVFLSGCWKVSIHPTIELWMESTARVIDSQKSISDR